MLEANRTDALLKALLASLAPDVAMPALLTALLAAAEAAAALTSTGAAAVLAPWALVMADAAATLAPAASDVAEAAAVTAAAISVVMADGSKEMLEYPTVFLLIVVAQGDQWIFVPMHNRRKTVGCYAYVGEICGQQDRQVMG